MFDAPDEYQQPDQGDRLRLSDLAGRLVAIRVDEYRPEQKARQKVKPAVAACVTLCDGPEAGRVYQDALLFGAVLVPQLQGKVGRLVLGRLRLGEERDGNNAPVILDPATQADVEVATRVMSAAPAPAAQQQAPAQQAPAAAAVKAPWEQ